MDCAHTVTTYADVLGTLAYAAPEQQQQSRVADQRADLFSVGRLFQFLVTGETAERLDGLPPGAAAVVRRATQPLADHRYATARDMKAALEERLGTPWSGTPLAVGEVLARSYEVGELAGTDSDLYAYRAIPLDTDERLALIVGGTTQACECLLAGVRALDAGARRSLGNPRVMREAWNWPFVVATGDDPLTTLLRLLGRSPRPKVIRALVDGPLFFAPLYALFAEWGGRRLPPGQFFDGVIGVVRPALLACNVLLAASIGTRPFGSVPPGPVTLGWLAGSLIDTLQKLKSGGSLGATEGKRLPLGMMEKGLERLVSDRNAVSHGASHEFRLKPYLPSLKALVDVAVLAARQSDWEALIKPAVVRDESGVWHVLESSDRYLPLTPGTRPLRVTAEARAWWRAATADTQA